MSIPIIIIIIIIIIIHIVDASYGFPIIPMLIPSHNFLPRSGKARDASRAEAACGAAQCWEELIWVWINTY